MMVTFTAIPSAFTDLYGSDILKVSNAKQKTSVPKVTLDPKRFIPTDNLNVLSSFSTPSKPNPKSTIDPSRFIPTARLLPTIPNKEATITAPKTSFISPALATPSLMEQTISDYNTNHLLAPWDVPKTWTGESWLAIKRASANFIKEIPLIPFKILGLETAYAPTEINGKPSTNIEDAIKQMHAQGYTADAELALQEYKKKLLENEITGRPSELARSDQLYPPGRIEKLFRDFTGAIPEFAALGYMTGPSAASVETLAESAARKILPKVGMNVIEKSATLLQKVNAGLVKSAIETIPFSTTWSAIRSKNVNDFPKNAAVDFATFFPLLVAGRGGKVLLQKGANAVMEFLAKAGERKIVISPQTLKDFLGGVENDQVSQVMNSLPIQTRVFFMESYLGESRLLALKDQGKKLSFGENRPARLQKDLFGNEIPESKQIPIEKYANMNMSKEEASNNFYEINYLTKDGNKGTVLPDFYDSKESARKITMMEDSNISKITSIKKIKPSENDLNIFMEGKTGDQIMLREKQVTTSDNLPSDQEVVTKLTQALKEAKSLRGQQEQIYSEERSLRLAKAMAVGERVPGEKGFYAQLGQLKGEYTKVEFESLRGKINQSEIDRLFGMVEQSKDLSGFGKIAAKSGLLKMFGEKGGAVPNKSELILLQRVFPKDMIDTLLGKRTLFQKFQEAGLQLLNTPRTIMASCDLSYGLRQGLFAAPRYRTQFFDSFKKQFSWFKSEEAFQASQEAITRNKWYGLAVEGELSFTEMDSLMGAREEAFMGQWAEKIPIVGKMVRASGRAYTGFANKFRMDIFSTLMEDAEKLGMNPTKNMDMVKAVADFVNTATGRGKLPGGLERAGPVLNAMFFSPRLMASRLNLLMPVRFIVAPSLVRKEYLKSLLTYAGTMTTVLTVAKLGGADVESDPRSSDFGKIKIGNTRFDIMGGFQQYIRMAAQLITGKYISSTTGKEYTLGEGYKPLTRYDILMRQIESKEAPVLSFITDILRQQDYAGQPVSVVKEIATRFYPMMISGLVDVARDDPKLLPLAALSIFGVGMQTYEPTSKTSGRDIFKQNRVAPQRINTATKKINTRINPYR